jgi:hypothetical protein
LNELRVAALQVPREIYERLRADLAVVPESVGFMLGTYHAESHQFQITDWRLVPDTGLESRSLYHVVLTDEARTEVIQWAWRNDACLLEAHSHDEAWDEAGASFSPSDISGLMEWVPHIWWRLRGRPYCAIVVDKGSFDALAWTEAPDTPVQVSSLRVTGLGDLEPTGLTLGIWNRGHGPDE